LPFVWDCSIVCDQARTSKGALMLQALTFETALGQHLSFMEAVFSALFDMDECMMVRR